MTIRTPEMTVHQNTTDGPVTVTMSDGTKHPITRYMTVIIDDRFVPLPGENHLRVDVDVSSATLDGTMGVTMEVVGAIREIKSNGFGSLSITSAGKIGEVRSSGMGSISVTGDVGSVKSTGMGKVTIHKN